VYKLEHTRIREDGEDDVKAIGIYSTEENAKEAIHRLSIQPGFRDFLEGFEVFCITLDKDDWVEGFITAENEFKKK